MTTIFKKDSFSLKEFCKTFQNLSYEISNHTRNYKGWISINNPN